MNYKSEREELRKGLLLWHKQQNNFIEIELKEFGYRADTIKNFPYMNNEEFKVWLRSNIKYPNKNKSEANRFTHPNIWVAFRFNHTAEKYLGRNLLSDALDKLTSAENVMWLVRKVLVGSSLKDAKSELAKLAVHSKLANDPKQAAKRFVKYSWLVWQEEPERYKFKSDFAKDMLKQEQCESLISQKKIEDWCREWEKTNLTG